VIKPYYQDDYSTIYHGDCREILPQLQPVDLVLTDPPYGIGENSKKQKSREKKAKPTDYGDFDWDRQPPKKWVLEMMMDYSDKQIIFGGNFFGLPAATCFLVWDKDNSGDFADCELAWTNLPGAVRIFKWRWNGMIQEKGGVHKEQRVHPTQKPVSLMQWCIEKAGEPQTILDPFMGSGTTLIAAKNLRLKAIGIELEEKYCEIAAKRLSQEVLPFG